MIASNILVMPIISELSVNAWIEDEVMSLTIQVSNTVSLNQAMKRYEKKAIHLLLLPQH